MGQQRIPTPGAFVHGGAQRDEVLLEDGVEAILAALAQPSNPICIQTLHPKWAVARRSRGYGYQGEAPAPATWQSPDRGWTRCGMGSSRLQRRRRSRGDSRPGRRARPCPASLTAPLSPGFRRHTVRGRVRGDCRWPAPGHPTGRMRWRECPLPCHCGPCSGPRAAVTRPPWNLAVPGCERIGRVDRSILPQAGGGTAAGR